MLESSKNNQFIVCPVCSGLGKNKYGLACTNCNGMGVGTFFNGRFFYWGPKLGRALIELDHIKNKIKIILNLITYAIGLLGLIALGYWGYAVLQNSFVLSDLYFWEKKHILLLVFWVSIIADMFLVYRISEDNRLSKKIKQFKYEDKIKKIDTPNNWDELKKINSHRKVDVSKGFCAKAYAIIEEAYMLAYKLNHPELKPIHLFFACLPDAEVGAVFTRLNVDSKKLIEKLKARINQRSQDANKIELSNEIKEVFVDAYIDAGKLGR
ncbi:MAG: hypothetical protein U9R06_01515, partial [Patescibacteria group bacterium]|nr:hypothetical protein [Patescibacteria group bacterium]